MSHQNYIYILADAPTPRVRVDEHPSPALWIGDVRIVFEDREQLRQVVERLGRLTESEAAHV